MTDYLDKQDEENKKKSLSVNLTLYEWDILTTLFNTYSSYYGIDSCPDNEKELQALKEKYKNAEDDFVCWSDVYEYNMRAMWSITKKIDNKKKADARSLTKLKNEISSPYIKEINELKLHIEKLNEKIDIQDDRLKVYKNNLKEKILDHENREHDNIKRIIDIEQKHSDIVHNLNEKIWNQEEELNDIKDKLKEILK
tara:strand:+ start:232 stop:822 length:591 start_codon:yes stop_codon:yes gene_type:complete